MFRLDHHLLKHWSEQHLDQEKGEAGQGFPQSPALGDSACGNGRCARCIDCELSCFSHQKMPEPERHESDSGKQQGRHSEESPFRYQIPATVRPRESYRTHNKRCQSTKMSKNRKGVDRNSLHLCSYRKECRLKPQVKKGAVDGGEPNQELNSPDRSSRYEAALQVAQ